MGGEVYSSQHCGARTSRKGEPVSPTLVGIIGTAGTVLAALVGAVVMLMISRRSEKRAEAAEERERDAEARAREADRLNGELGRWSSYAEELRADIARLNKELTAERARANRVQELLDARTRDLRLAERELERLKARLDEPS